jgi:uncharacterized membrane protein
MIEAVISGLLVAALSGLAFLSYKHHEGYVLISTVLKLLVVAVYISAFSYTIGFLQGGPKGMEDMFFSFGWVSFGLFALLFYLFFLDFLPMLTKKNNKENKK